ncbi:hypothetical protein C6501_14930 [Candidatus Poribacteria bacterium]|nr:MAG: hypothetical protein C6501_14930 [Candidatus Poribacteria bacterium]
MQSISFNFHSDSLFTLTDKIKASVEGRMTWGDTFGIGLGSKSNKHLIVWTPKVTSERQILPGFDSKDGELTLKMKPRPGAWVSWIDEAKVQASALDDYDRVHKSVQELERNARQITDFADGVLTNITVQHLGKSLTLSELTEEVLQSRLIVPSTIKTGGFVLAKTADTDCSTAKVVIPEQTHIHRIHLNEDAVLTGVEKEGDDTVLVVLRTHIKNYPDLVDLGYSLALHERFLEDATSDTQPAVRILSTAAVYDPLESQTLKLVPVAFNASPKEIEEAITNSSSKIEDYMTKASQHAYQLMTQFHQGVESRLRALMLNRGQRIHNKVWDDLVIRELRNTIGAFSNFYAEYLGEHFEEEATKTTTEVLRESIDPIIEFWQLQENHQFTLNHMIQSSYTLTNQILDKAAALFHDLVFQTNFIATGLIVPVEAKIFEDDVPLDEIYLPEWTSGTVREKMTRIGLRSTLHPRQIERMRNVWLTLLEIANFASRHSQDFEKVIQPLENILLAMKSATAQRNNRTNRQTQPKFSGFEVTDTEFEELLTHVKDHFPTIKRWIEQAPRETEKLQAYYNTLWVIVLNGKYREKLLDDFKPTCDINLSVPDQTKRLMNLTLSSQLVVENEKDRKILERNLNRALVVKTGHNLRDITTSEKLAIHGDVTLSLLRQELVRYDETLTKRATRLTNPTRKGKKRNDAQARNNGNATSETIQAEQTKVTEMIAFLKPYRESEVISTLANAGLNKSSAELEKIRKQQVLSFDLSELPAIGETWLTEIKTLEDYPNLRMFLLQNKLPISTTGRILMELRGILSDSLFNQVLGLIQEVKELQNSSYEGEVLDRFVAYISEKVWRWELTQITSEQLPVVVKEKVLTSAICYEKEVEALMEYVERYDELLQTKLKADSEMNVERENLESRFQEIVETLL